MTSLHYERDLNLYICGEDGHFLGAINWKILLKQDIDLAEGKALKLRDVCVQTAEELFDGKKENI